MMYNLNMKTIYISIASYNEPYLDLMISNCLENAEYPERIYFGIWCHYNDGNRPNFDKYKNVIYGFTDYPTMLGTNVGRLNAMSFYNKQDYYLQLDAHMLFQKKWDTKIINAFQEIKKNYKNPIISTHVPWWSMSNGKINYYNNELEVLCSPLKIDTVVGNSEGYPKPTANPLPWGKENYKEHALVTGHFIFSEPSIIENVCPDPQIMYAGEEILQSLRLWTRGYRIFTIRNPIVWHLNKFDGDLYYKDRLMNTEVKGKEHDLHNYKNQIALERVEKILTGEILGYWGAPTLEKLKEFEKIVNVDFKEFYSISLKN